MNKILLFTSSLNLAVNTLIVKLMCKQKKVKLFLNVNKRIKMSNSLLTSNIEVLTLR